MKNYIGVKMLQATPMDLAEFNRTRNKVVPATLGEEGYLVVYPDGYESWSPKEVFEAAYLPLEQGNKITTVEINNLLADIQTSRVDDKTTLVKAELVTGFIQYETSSCVDPINYDENIGRIIAGKKIEDRIWFAMRFVLQWAKYGLKNTTNKKSITPNQGMPSAAQIGRAV